MTAIFETTNVFTKTPTLSAGADFAPGLAAIKNSQAQLVSKPFKTPPPPPVFDPSQLVSHAAESMEKLQKFRIQLVEVMQKSAVYANQGAQGAQRVKECELRLKVIQKSMQILADDILASEAHVIEGLKTLEKYGVTVTETASAPAEVSYIVNGVKQSSRPLNSCLRTLNAFSTRSTAIVDEAGVLARTAAEYCEAIKALEAAQAANRAADIVICAKRAKTALNGIEAVAGVETAGIGLLAFEVVMMPVNDILDHLEHNARMESDPVYRDKIDEALRFIAKLKEDKSIHEVQDNTRVEDVALKARKAACSDMYNHNLLINAYLNNEDAWNETWSSKNIFLNSELYKQEYNNISTQNGNVEFQRMLRFPKSAY